MAQLKADARNAYAYYRYNQIFVSTKIIFIAVRMGGLFFMLFSPIVHNNDIIRTWFRGRAALFSFGNREGYHFTGYIASRSGNSDRVAG